MQSPPLRPLYAIWLGRFIPLFLLILVVLFGVRFPHSVTYAGQPAVLIKDINPSGSSKPATFVVIGSVLFFTADDGADGRELWRSDGTTGGTVLVKDINPGANTAFQQQGMLAFLTALNGVLFFAADNGVTGRELWRSDGTAAGTMLVKDITPGSATSHLTDFVTIGTTLYFVAEDGIHGAELWKSDGTENGTVLVKDITLNDNGYEHGPDALENVNGQLYFIGDDGTSGGELWTSDGSAIGTGLVKDINPLGSSSPFEYTVVGDTVFFTAENVANGRELWKTDGTTDGTVLVKDIDSGSVAGSAASSRPHDLVAYKGYLYFFVENDAQNFGTLWKSDGTASGTVRVKEITSGSNPYPGGIIRFNDLLIFSASTREAGWEMWRTDGTTTGTFLLKDIVPGPQSALGGVYYNSLRNVYNTLFFSPDDGIHGSELWSSDGTSTGTVLLQDIAPGNLPSTPADYIGLNGQIIFTADDGTAGQELWALPFLQQRIYIPISKKN